MASISLMLDQTWLLSQVLIMGHNSAVAASGGGHASAGVAGAYVVLDYDACCCGCRPESPGC